MSASSVQAAAERPSPLASQYRAVWSHEAYRNYAPGEHHVDAALAALKPTIGASFIDFGCGTGRPAAELRKRGYGVVGVDFADNCLDRDVDMPLLVADISKPLGLTAAYGYCTDVMEHVEPEQVDAVLLSICEAVKVGVFFAISLVPDAFGPMLLGQPLHLTIRDAQWWQQRLEACWPRVEILSRSASVLTAACFTSPPRFRTNVLVEAPCNTGDGYLLANVELNSRRDVPWLLPLDVHDGHAVMVGGGASLESTLDEIRARAAAGQTIFALNNAANFLRQHDIVPDYQLVLDARPENIAFVQPRVAKKYLLASQVHPSLFDELAGADVTMFHYGMTGARERLPKGRQVCFVGGSYVLGPVAMSVATVLGFRNLHLYGYDSSDADDGRGHAYAQSETRGEQKRIDVLFNDKTYRCSFGMFKQAEQFPQFAQMLADHGCTITVHGDGLLPAMARDMVLR